jgi:hypothetical protein
MTMADRFASTKIELSALVKTYCDSQGLTEPFYSRGLWSAYDQGSPVFLDIGEVIKQGFVDAVIERIAHELFDSSEWLELIERCTPLL